MKDHKTRMKQIRTKISKYRDRREKRRITAVSILCLFLTTGMGKILLEHQSLGDVTVQDSYGTMLLREGEQPYIVVGLAAFVVGASVTIACIKWNDYCKKRKEGH